MQMLVFNEAIDKLALADSVCWNSHVLSRKDGPVFRRVLEFEIDLDKPSPPHCRSPADV